MLTRIAHVCLNVRSLPKSLDYYTALGLTVKFRFTRNAAVFGAYLEIAPGSYLELFETAGAPDAHAGNIAHFCLETDDIDGFISRCRSAPITVTPKKLGCDRTWQVWLKDPDGNAFEVHQYTEKSSQRTGENVEADW
ncbi:MAG: VOC family protein [Chitinispirillaceae bacterium]|nr:VOC family protein [Chitinispirillaceae bacterium]